MYYRPVRGKRNTPIFDPSWPNTLRQYFAQLETLFIRCSMITDLEEKDFATQYLKCRNLGSIAWVLRGS